MTCLQLHTKYIILLSELLLVGLMDWFPLKELMEVLCKLEAFSVS